MRTGKIHCMVMNRFREKGRAFPFHAPFYSDSQANRTAKKKKKVRVKREIFFSLVELIYCFAVHEEETHVAKIVMITSEGKRAKWRIACSSYGIVFKRAGSMCKMPFVLGNGSKGAAAPPFDRGDDPATVTVIDIYFPSVYNGVITKK